MNNNKISFPGFFSSTDSPLTMSGCCGGHSHCGPKPGGVGATRRVLCNGLSVFQNRARSYEAHRTFGFSTRCSSFPIQTFAMIYLIQICNWFVGQSTSLDFFHFRSQTSSGPSKEMTDDVRTMVTQLRPEAELKNTPNIFLLPVFTKSPKSLKWWSGLTNTRRDFNVDEWNHRIHLGRKCLDLNIICNFLSLSLCCFFEIKCHKKLIPFWKLIPACFFWQAELIPHYFKVIRGNYHNFFPCETTLEKLSGSPTDVFRRGFH